MPILISGPSHLLFPPCDAGPPALAWRFLIIRQVSAQTPPPHQGNRKRPPQLDAWPAPLGLMTLLKFQTAWASILLLLSASLGKLPSLSVPLCPHLRSGDT